LPQPINTQFNLLLNGKNQADKNKSAWRWNQITADDTWVAALSKLESKRLAGKTNQAAEETEVRAAWYVLQGEDGESNRGPAGLDDGEARNWTRAATRTNWNNSPQI
jgi:hypothetical protein